MRPCFACAAIAIFSSSFRALTSPSTSFSGPSTSTSNKGPPAVFQVIRGGAVGNWRRPARGGWVGAALDLFLEG